MAEEIICRKGRGHFWDFIGVEIFFGLATTAMLLVAILLPLEEDVAYIRYIFAGFRYYSVFLVCGGVRSRQVCPFAGLFAEESGFRNLAGQFQPKVHKTA